MRIFITSWKVWASAVLALMFCATAQAQDSTASPVKLEHQEVGSTSYFSRQLSKLDIGGYYRGYFWARKMSNPYDEFTRNPIMRGGDIYQNPFLFMYIGATPTPNTSLGGEIFLGDSFDAFLGTTSPRRMGPFNTMVLRGNINTKYGNWYVRAGGIEWIRLSPFTFGNNVGYNRYSIFERQPWDPGGHVKSRYASYYHSGTINQDVRFGTNAFKGFIASGTGLPGRTSVDIFYGKSQNNGGAERENNVLNRANVGFRVGKAFGKKNSVSLNTFNSTARTDSINSNINVQWQIITSEFDFHFAGLNLYGEVGGGFYESPNYKRAWSEGIILNLRTPAKYTGLPFEFRYFRIGENFTSNVAQFQNTSIREVNTGVAGTNATGVNLQPFGGNMTGVGGLANNRQGAAINTEAKIRKLKIVTGIQFESEMKKLNAGRTLTYSHRINALAWSRLAYNFPAVLEGTSTPYSLGPNKRVNTYYRGVYENVNTSQTSITGTDTIPLYKNHYNAFDIQLKYNERILGRDAYFFILSSFQSAQNKFSFIPKANDDAYIRAQFHEAEVYYHIFRDLTVSGYFGLELIKGNKFTDTTSIATSRTGVSGLARDQIGKGTGFGLDFTLSNNTTIYFRHRWIRFQDNSFKDEDFKGTESNIELKIYF